jgi:hypothetical protein
MVNGTPKTRLQCILHYPFVTISLNIPRFLGLNMIEPHKPLIDSGLAVFLLSVSNKTAPKVMKNAPIFTGARSK